MLYAVDMRLWPSGRQGPVATRLSAFRRYQREEAWTWKHMARTRARFGADAAAAIDAAIAAPRDPAKTLRAVRQMRPRVAEARRGERADPRVFKTAEGGLMDVGCALQTGLLLTGTPGARAPDEAAPLRRAGWLTEEAAGGLFAAHGLGLALQQIERVALDRPFDAAAAGPGLRAAMARAGGAPDFETLEARLRPAQAEAVGLVDAILGAA